MALNVTRPSRFKSYAKAATTDGTQVTVYTVPANTVAYLSLIYVVNAANATTDLNLNWYDASATTTYKLLGSKQLTAKDFLQISGAFYVLEAGDIIRATPNNTSSGSPNVTITVTVEEVFLPSG